MVKVGKKELRTAPARGKVGSGPRPATLADGTAATGRGGKFGSTVYGKYTTSRKRGKGGGLAQRLGAGGAGKIGALARKGKPSNKPKRCKGGEPVDVFSGEVLQTQEDLFIVGGERLVFRREYSSAWCKEVLPFGRGWTHNFHQSIVLVEGSHFFRDEDGRTVNLGVLEDGQSRLYRGLRLEVRRKDQAFEVESLDTGRVRLFAPLKKGEPAVLRKITEPSRRTTRLEYSGGRLVKITSPYESAFALRYDEQGRIVRLEEVNRDGRTLSACTYDYLPTRELGRVVDAVQTELRFGYDDFHRLASAKLPTGATFHWTYDEGGRCTETWGTGRLHHWRFQRDLQTREVVVSGVEQLRIFQFGGQGQLLAETDGLHRLLREYEYDDDLMVVTERDGLGQTTRYEYDAQGALLARTDPAGNTTHFLQHSSHVVESPPDGRGLERHYDPRGYLICTRLANGEERHYDRDKLGRIEAIFSRSGLVEERRLDDRDQVVWKKDAAGLVTELCYDERGYPTEKRDSLGRTWSFAHDAYGRLRSETGPDGAKRQRDYDAFGNTTKEVDPLGRVTWSVYKGTGELSSVRHTDGRAWRYERNTNEELVRVINPHFERTDYDVNLLGQRVAEVSFDGRRFKQSYTRHGKPYQLNRPDGTFRGWRYDRLGNITFESSSHGGRAYERDGRGRVQRVVADDGPESFVIEYIRDELGRIVREKQGEHELRFEYDPESRVVAREVAGERTEYEYDRLGNLTAVTHLGKRTELHRDAAGREVRRTTASQRVSVESEWDSNDRLIQRRIVSRELEPESELGVVRGRPLLDGPLIPGQLVEKRVVGERSLEWDAVGRLLGIEDQTWGRTSYEYNSADLLTTATRGRSAEYFVFDSCGSLSAALRTFDGAEQWPKAGAEASVVPLHPAAAVRRRTDDPGLAVSNVPGAPPLIGQGWSALMSDGALTRLVTQPGNQLIRHADRSFEVDALGRRTRRKHKKSGETTQYIWDCRDQLREVRLPGGWKVRFFYDAFGRRVRKDVERPVKQGAALQAALAKELLRRVAAANRGEDPGPPPPEEGPEGYSVTYLWDDHEVCAEIWSHGKKRVHVHERGTFVPLLQSEGRQVLQVVTDHLGTPKDLVDELGRVIWTVAHGAWGNVTEGLLTDALVESPFRLLGQLYDPETGLHWTRFRVFETSTARWLSPDPLGLEGGNNAFGFDGAPTITVDPLGLSCESGKIRAFLQRVLQCIWAELHELFGTKKLPPSRDAAALPPPQEARGWRRLFEKSDPDGIPKEIPDTPHDAPQRIVLPPQVTKEMQEHWDNSFPNGRAQEWGGTVVRTSSGEVLVVNSQDGGSRTFLANRRVPPNTTVIGVTHTHPYDSTEKNHTNVSLSGGDAADMINKKDHVVLAQSGDGQYMFLRTRQTPSSADDDSMQRASNDRADEYVNQGQSFGQATRTTAREIAEMNDMAYYEGSNGILERVHPPPQIVPPSRLR